jgi:ubiquinone/menaquinone biosynthesis C-methylase UbiE
VGYVFRLEDAQSYDEWFQSEPGRSVLTIEKELLSRVWSPQSPQSVLEVGCGTGLFLEWFAEKDHQVTGLEPSQSMLNVARHRLPGRITLDRGYAEHLPYDNNSFDTVALITTLEFADNPSLALREALRVAKCHVLLGALNKYSLIALHRYIERFWRKTVYRHAQFFSVFELQSMTTMNLTGRAPLKWRTSLSFPLRTLNYLQFLERSRFFQWHPFGHFIAMRIDLRYPLQTIQEPLFCELPSGIGHAGFHASCWRYGKEAPVPYLHAPKRKVSSVEKALRGQA